MRTKHMTEAEVAVLPSGTFELFTLADTINVLNGDDALEMLKTTLPGIVSFMQLVEASPQMRARAVAALEVAKSGRTGGRNRK